MDNANVVPVDAGMMRFYEELSAATPPEAIHWPIDKQREGWNAVCRAFRAPRPANLKTEDVAVSRDSSRVAVRIYRPTGARTLPGVIYFHGGGWVLGSLESHDDMCAEIADRAQVAVVAVDYRLAPEHPHPAQLEDNLAVLEWVHRAGKAHGIDARNLVAAGDSAGGQMSASLAMYLRDQRLPQFRGLVLIYPVLGLDLETPSYKRNANAPCLTRDDMIYYWNSVLGTPGNPNWRDKYIIPLLEKNYSLLPPTFLTAAGHDPLYDDAVILADRLRGTGISVELRREPALAHSYMRARHVSKTCAEAFDAIVDAVRSLAHEGHLPGKT